MIRTVTKIIGSPYQFGDKWHLIVESRNYGKAPNHILLFENKEEADRVCIGYEYSTDDIFREPRKEFYKTLSIQQPYALLAAMGVKDIENRTWKTDYRGRIYIHACAYKPGSGLNVKYHLTDKQRGIVSGYPFIKSLLEDKEQMYSAIIGHVELVNIVKDSSSIWAVKDHYHWILENPVLFESPYINVKGQLNFWDCREYLINGKF